MAKKFGEVVIAKDNSHYGLAWVSMCARPAVRTAVACPAEVSRRPDARLRFRRETRQGNACASTPGTQLNNARAGGQAGCA
jgi:hypothetical protein